MSARPHVALGDSRTVTTTVTLKMQSRNTTKALLYFSDFFSKMLCEVVENEAVSQVPLKSKFRVTSGVLDPFQPSLIFIFLIIISHCHRACYFWKEGMGRWSLNDNKSRF